MTRVERYLFGTATTAFLTGLVVLTEIIWITQALRQIDLLTSKGQTALIFLTMTGLAVPSLVAIIAPVALFGGVLYTLNKLNGDSELVVMAAAGVSPARLLRPLALLSGLVFVAVAALYIQVLPWSFGAIQRLTTFVHADFIANFARPGAFTQLELGFVFHFRERTPDGALRGVFMQDWRDPAHITTYTAEAGKTVDRGGASYLQLSKGVLLRPQSSGNSAIVTFDDYTIDLSQFMRAVSAIKKPRERTTAQLLRPSLRPDRCHQLTTRLPFRRAGCTAVRATPDGSHVHLEIDRRARRPALPLRHRHGYAADIHRGLLAGCHIATGSSPTPQASRVRTATSPYPPDLSWWAVKRRQTLVSRVHLPVLLTGPAPSGSAGTSRRCQGCSHPPRRLLDQAAPSFTQPLRRPGDEGLSPPSTSDASWRTWSSAQSSPTKIIECHLLRSSLTHLEPRGHPAAD